MGKSISIANDGITNYFQIKVNNLENWIVDRFEYSLINIKKTFIKIFPNIIAFMNVGFLVSIIPLVFLLFYGAYLCGKGQLQISEYIVIINLGIPITTVMTGLSQDMAGLQASKAAMLRLNDIWISPDENEAFKNSDVYNFGKNVVTEIDIENMSFGYSEKNMVFKDFNLSFESNKKYVIVGENGCGKYTLMNILTALYLPKQGKINYAFELCKKDINEFRNKISLVEQNSYLFEDTVSNNIFIDETDSDKINRWYDESFLAQIIKKLPQGKDTLIKDGGNNLSGGQKRCVNVARGLVRDANLVFLDEPTANIDKTTAQLISEEIVRVAEKYKKTIIIITHDENLLQIGENVEKIELKKLIAYRNGGNII